jgi:hypothetical protein
MRLLAQLLEHWSRATAIESAFSNQCAKQNVPYSRANLNPAFAGWTAQRRFRGSQATTRIPIFRQRVGGAILLGRKERKDFCGGSAELDVIRRLRIVTPAATSCHNRPVTRNSSVLIRVIRGFKMRLHQRSDELDVNPRSVVPSSANARNHPVGASD